MRLQRLVRRYTANEHGISLDGEFYTSPEFARPKVAPCDDGFFLFVPENSTQAQIKALIDQLDSKTQTHTQGLFFPPTSAELPDPALLRAQGKERSKSKTRAHTKARTQAQAHALAHFFPPTNCAMCGKTFAPKPTKKYCDACAKERQRTRVRECARRRRARDPEAHRAYMREFHAANRERVNAVQRERRAAMSEEALERKRESQRRYYQKNIERERAKARAKYADDVETARARIRARRARLKAEREAA